MTKKSFLLSVLVIILWGCNPYSRGDANVITFKSYRKWGGGKMQDCICRFYLGDAEFEDSCHFYNMGDTIISPKIYKR